MGKFGKSAWLRVYRAAVFVGVLMLMHRGEPEEEPEELLGATVEDLRKFFPAAVGVSGRAISGARVVVGTSRDELGFVITTSPDSDDIIGYSGPNNVMLAFGIDGKVLGMSVLESGDTPEHVAPVMADEAFMSIFDGKDWEEIKTTDRVDGVSGATLTSLAIAEGVIRRVAGTAPSLRFPRPLELADAQRIFPQATELKSDGVVYGNSGLLGRLHHTSPHSDNLIGYGGPSDVLVGVSGEGGKILGMVIRDTYDTEKYVGYVRDEAAFMQMFNGKKLEQLADFLLEENEVEGVSGATMTSLTVAEAVIALARAETWEQVGGRETFWGSTETWFTRQVGSRGIGTVLVVLFGLVMAFTKLRGIRWLRIAFQLVLIVYLGLVNGDLISQALLVGWAQNGVAWQFAPGLLLLVASALLVPLVAGKQVYCHQLCPHGAAQQLLKNALPKRFRIRVPARLVTVLRLVPFLLLLLVVVVGVRQLTFNLVSIEPFYAYLFRVAGWATIAIAVVGLVASLFVPMAYCRYGCPTGAMLNFLWGGGRAGTFSRRDGLALACLALAVGLRIF
ncbi:MAG: NosR/NirI family nitrous oxide reductase transcriptional regulator [Verrucomicrobiales bacterium]|jgi:NosR/NirI family nitrous oxide reductase transcriptional regulator